MDDKYKVMILRSYGHNTRSEWETTEAEFLTDAEYIFFEVIKTDVHLLQAKIVWGDTLIHDYKELKI